MKFLDTNIILRYLTRDDEQKAQACFALFQRVKQGQVTLLTSETRYYIEIFNAAVQGVSAEELAERLGKSTVAVTSVLRRAKQTIEHLRPPELRGAERAETFIKSNIAAVKDSKHAGRNRGSSP